MYLLHKDKNSKQKYFFISCHSLLCSDLHRIKSNCSRRLITPQGVTHIRSVDHGLPAASCSSTHSAYLVFSIPHHTYSHHINILKRTIHDLLYHLFICFFPSICMPLYFPQFFQVQCYMQNRQNNFYYIFSIRLYFKAK